MSDHQQNKQLNLEPNNTPEIYFQIHANSLPKDLPLIMSDLKKLANEALQDINMAINSYDENYNVDEILDFIEKPNDINELRKKYQEVETLVRKDMHL